MTCGEADIKQRQCNLKRTKSSKFSKLKENYIYVLWGPNNDRKSSTCLQHNNQSFLTPELSGWHEKLTSMITSPFPFLPSSLSIQFFTIVLINVFSTEHSCSSSQEPYYCLRKSTCALNRTFEFFYLSLIWQRQTGIFNFWYLLYSVH